MIPRPKWFRELPYKYIGAVWNFLSTQFVCALIIMVWALIFENHMLSLMAGLFMLPFALFFIFM